MQSSSHDPTNLIGQSAPNDLVSFFLEMSNERQALLYNQLPRGQQQPIIVTNDQRPPSYSAAPTAPTIIPQYNVAYQSQAPGSVQYHGQTNPVNPQNIDAYIYLALAIILTVLFSFSGIGVVMLICTIPAYVTAKEAIAAGETGRHDIRLAKVGLAHTCIFVSCCFGSILVFLAVSGIITLISMNLSYASDICEAINNIQNDNNNDYDYYYSC